MCIHPQYQYQYWWPLFSKSSTVRGKHFTSIFWTKSRFSVLEMLTLLQSAGGCVSGTSSDHRGWWWWLPPPSSPVVGTWAGGDISWPALQRPHHTLTSRSKLTTCRRGDNSARHLIIMSQTKRNIKTAFRISSFHLVTKNYVAYQQRFFSSKDSWTCISQCITVKHVTKFLHFFHSAAFRVDTLILLGNII